jgi:hypothetical protein
MQALSNSGLLTKGREAAILCWGGQVLLGGATYWET